MCFLKKPKQPANQKNARKAVTKHNNKKKRENYLVEDASIKHEAHSRWEAEDIYDEDDFKD